MCGIAGIVADQSAAIDAMLDGIRHRGPDANGIARFPEANLSLAHARLSIIDLDERSNQPFYSACGRYCLVFNGEIYNYMALRALLLDDGAELTTKSDTEVLLLWLIQHGADGIAQLDGMFAFCLYDSQQQSLLLARDHLGEKPLYFAATEHEFAFASEFQVLAGLEFVDKRINRQGLRNYLTFLYTAPPHTLLEGIKELAPGEILLYSLKDRQLQSSEYFKLVNELPETGVRSGRAADTNSFAEEFHSAVASRMVADLPVGLYLSGGLDSNAIAAAVQHGYSDLVSFTMSYSSDPESAEYDESDMARRCAEYYGIENNTVVFDSAQPLDDALKSTLAVFGQPFGNATSLVASQLAEQVVKRRKVCLIGDGGDELLCGYPRYRAVRLYRKARAVPQAVRSLLLFLIQKIPERGLLATRVRRVRQFLEGLQLPLSEAYLKWVSYADTDELNAALASGEDTEFYLSLRNTFETFEADPVRAAEIVDFVSFVPNNLLQAADRTSMRHGLELRSPFVARALVVKMLSMSSHNKLSSKFNKPLLVEALRQMLPEFIYTEKKKPFNPPMRNFIQQNIDRLESYLCSPDESRLATILDRRFLQKELTEFRQGGKDNSTYLWGLAVMEYWLRDQFHGQALMLADV